MHWLADGYILISLHKPMIYHDFTPYENISQYAQLGCPTRLDPDFSVLSMRFQPVH